MPASRPVLRFAPSPNGYLHLGHALSALVTWEWARRLGGRALLRIEDIDQGRSRPELVAAILEDLAWLGLVWEGPVERQFEQLDVYRASLARLHDMGVLFACYATRREIEAAARAEAPPRLDPDGTPVYPGAARVLPEAERRARAETGAPFALRLEMGKAMHLAMAKNGGPLGYRALDEHGAARRVDCTPQRWGDVVLARKDTHGSYHLCVVVDDARQGITHVTRGRDLEAATDVHRVLQVLLDLPEPLYHHHRLITDAQGRKLSKSAGDTSLRSLRAQGATPRDIRRMIGLPASD